MRSVVHIDAINDAKLPTNAVQIAEGAGSTYGGICSMLTAASQQKSTAIPRTIGISHFTVWSSSDLQ
jgi:hypothetical protein